MQLLSNQRGYNLFGRQAEDHSDLTIVSLLTAFLRQLLY